MAAGLRSLPSVGELLNRPECAAAVAQYGHDLTVAALRSTLTDARAAMLENARAPDAMALAAAALARLLRDAQPLVKPVFNLTGVVIHTNLGRALLAEEAIAAAATAMREAMALEFDLGQGKRGERDGLLRKLLCELTGAEDATIVNNNAAAVLLTLNTIAKGREVVVSRGELIEIGGAFRMPDVMQRAGARLREVGTTNRTHARDYSEAITQRTAALMKVHPSNYRVQGFSSEVAGADVASIAHAAGLPFVNDLGSGVLIDLSGYGLAREQTVAEAVAEGADLVTFSGDKLLGGAQAGFIVGKRALIAQINKNPLKRVLRVDKIRLAATEATLRLYRDPTRLAQKLPTLRHLSRKRAEIAAMGQTLLPAARAAFTDYAVDVVDCESQIGSGAMPLHGLPSAALAFRAKSQAAVKSLAQRLRAEPKPIVGRIENGALLLDLRCLDDSAELATAFARFGKPA
ncbi:MAG: L-seryl-tRNA(Sec) selenium transferase [Hyphomicrobiales bacterium]|nr:L-seryl-tRNA(Sec) selenium transferase [Hyphomicrobiales bacterium]